MRPLTVLLVLLTRIRGESEGREGLHRREMRLLLGYAPMVAARAGFLQVARRSCYAEHFRHHRSRGHRRGICLEQPSRTDDGNVSTATHRGNAKRFSVPGCY